MKIKFKKRELRYDCNSIYVYWYVLLYASSRYGQLTEANRLLWYVKQTRRIFLYFGRVVQKLININTGLHKLRYFH